MTELLFKKKDTDKFLGIYVYCFWKARDHPRDKEAEIVENTISDFLKDKGWLRQ